MSKRILFITRTSLLLAIAIISQFLGKFIGPHNNFIVGPIVNAILLVATHITGILGGIIISVVAPLVSALTNKAPIAPIILAFSPFIIGGNIVYVLLYALIKNRNSILGIAVGSVVKAAFLYASVKAFLYFMKINEPVATTLTTLFSWPQLLTAVIGGAIALAVIPAVKKVAAD
ncbi:MAG: ECF transporter S component [Clostridiaceae bacterium]|nr:ECF transporter S component [Clostridiaceae bacterium]